MDSLSVPGLALAAALVLHPSHAHAAVDRGTVSNTSPRIEAYEPNLLGYTWQNDDVPFVDFTVSLKYQLLRRYFREWTCPHATDGCGDRLRAYLAFTGHFGFYARSRKSDPVIARQYTPKLIVRYTPTSRMTEFSRSSRSGPVFAYSDYWDFAYAHESNGQTTDTPELYQFERVSLERPEFALDGLSRGWDYVQVAGKHTLDPESPYRLTAFADLKFFLRHGFVQGTPEEYHSWENDPRGRPRHAFDGITGAIEYSHPQAAPSGANLPTLSSPRVLLQYQTGYAPAFRYNTFRLELGAQVVELPIALWVQHGYNASLARYYMRTTAFGVEFRFAE